ncbi:MAG TPA: hypothetical protein VNC18_03270 [Gemmatimonadaceae bacterium]|nr:hypothetical protein [Gemmatimonadaceae bacterium]
MASHKSSRRSRGNRNEHPPRPSAPPVAWYARIAWVPVGITLVVILTAFFSADPIRDAVTLGTVGEARLSVSAGYIAIAPLSAVLDTITLLTVAQHIAVLFWVILVYVGWRVRSPHKPTTPLRETGYAGILLGGIVVTYAAAALLPRPMAALATSDDTVLSIDFHAHTKYSHDGRPGWTEDDVRSWHRAAGYDVAYVTDHATFEGAERGIAANPGQAGEGTMVLQGLEAFFRGEHVNILDAGRRYKGITTPDRKDVDEQSLAIAGILPQTTPVIIETIPGDLSKIPVKTTQGTTGVVAIEIVDGSPRGLSQTRRERPRIVRIADSLNLAVVVGSDNHGWGRAAPGWTLMRIPGWRGMTTDSLSRRIEEVLRVGRRESTRSVERRVAGGASPIALAFAAPAIAWRMLTTLSPDERVMWIVWVWAFALAPRVWRSARERRASTA